MEPLVSICCITYNHVEYIEETLQGFLSQKTDFLYEILIHDDASTDGTVEVIRKYEKKYPEIIKPIYQKENQYTKGVSKIDYTFNQTRARGKYIAICEGDDFWINNNKLQLQVDYMKNNPKCTFCFHNALVIDESDKRKEAKLFIKDKYEHNQEINLPSEKFDAGELQLLGFIPTASFMYPKYVMNNPPSWYFEAPVGDNATKLLASSFGYAYFLNKPMSVYRKNVPGSVMTKWKKEDKGKSLSRFEETIKMLNSFDEYTNYKYHKNIQFSKWPWLLYKSFYINDFSELNNPDFVKYYKTLPLLKKIRVYIACNLPIIYEFTKKINEKAKTIYRKLL